MPNNCKAFGVRSQYQGYNCVKKLSFFSKNDAVVGLDLGSEWLKLVKIRPEKGGYVLDGFARCPWQGADLDNNAATAKKIQSVWEQLGVKEHTVVSSMAGHAVIVKRVTFEADSSKALADVVLKDARQYIPFDINDVFLDYQVLGPGQKENTYDVLLVASKKKVVQNLSDIISKSNLDLSIIDVDSFAICNSFEFNYPEFENKPVYLLDIGGVQSVFCIYHNFQPVFLREVSFGGKIITDLLAAKLGMKRVDAERIKIIGKNDLDDIAMRDVYDALQKTIKGWCDELMRLIGFYQSSSNTVVPVESLFLSGGGALLAGVQEIFHKELKINIEFHDPFRKVHIDSNLFQKEYVRAIASQMVVPFGLALRSI